MKFVPPKIVVIHDDLSMQDPLIFILQDKYGKDNVILINESQKGIEYVSNNLSQKMIVLLDLTFKGGEPTGIEVFQAIKNETSLVYIIIITAKDLAQVPAEDLKRFINDGALAFLSATDDYVKIAETVEKANHQLDVSVAAVLEQWIKSRPNTEREKPYLMNYSGKEYSLNDILIEIRQQSKFGLKMEKNILLLAIDLLTRGIEKVDD